MNDETTAAVNPEEAVEHVRLKYMLLKLMENPKHPLSDALTDDEVKLLPLSEQQTIAAARKKRQRVR